MGGKVREAVDKACGGVLFVRLLGFVFKVKLFDKQCTAAFLRKDLSPCGKLFVSLQVLFYRVISEIFRSFAVGK